MAVVDQLEVVGGIVAFEREGLGRAVVEHGQQMTVGIVADVFTTCREMQVGEIDHIAVAEARDHDPGAECSVLSARSSCSVPTPLKVTVTAAF